jgi:hypothetical protein
MQTDKLNPSAEKAQTALLARLDQLCRKPVKPPKSLQPTPEATKTRLARLRKKRLLLQRSKDFVPSRLDARSRNAGS